jgi:transglutaminase-like putative cysteine protease
MTNHRLTFAASIAVAACSLSLYAVLKGDAWMVAGLGAIAAAAIAGSLTRLATIPATVAAVVTVLIAVVPLVTGPGWLGVAGAVVLVALAAASATGARLLRGYAILATYCGCQLIYLNLVFASAASYIGIIPAARSIAVLAHMPSRASPQFGYSPPVTATRPIDFVAAAGIGAIAIIVDIVAVRMRRPALAGLPLLLLFSVPVASNLKGFGINQSLTFGAGIAAFLALLSTDGRQRLRMWGRLVTVRRVHADEAGAGPDTRDLAATGRRIGLAAVCLAIIVPLALPGRPHDVFAKTSYGGLGGPGSAGTVSPLLTVQSQLSQSKPRQVLTYTTTNADPQEQYLQDWVLNYNASSDEWFPVGGTDHQLSLQALPEAVPGLAIEASKITTKIDLLAPAAGLAPLPMPYAPVRFSLPSPSVLEQAGSLMLFDDQQQAGLRYAVTSLEPDPSPAQLSIQGQPPAAIQREYGAYTGPNQSQLQNIAQRETAGALTPLQQADDLQKWFNSAKFTYTLQPSLPRSHWLLKFLTTDPHGNCQQFAPAFAVLARLLGIPSRVAVGYTAGTTTGGVSPATVWQVTSADAHAWPELYFPSVGWVRFEPTPSGADGQGTAFAPLYSIRPATGQSTTGPKVTPSAAPTPRGPNPSGGGKRVSLGGPGGPATITTPGPGLPVGILAAIVIAALLVWPAATRWVVRRRRWITASSDAALAHAAWRELIDFLADYGLSGRPSESPRTTVARVSDEAGLEAAGRAAISRIGAAEERARYSLTAQPATGLHADVSAVRKALAASSTWGTRLRARLLPASTLSAAASGVQSLSRATSWIDSSWPTMRRQLRRAILHRAS